VCLEVSKPVLSLSKGARREVGKRLF